MLFFIGNKNLFKNWYRLLLAFANSEYVLLGNHGWDNLNSEMQAMFVAQGPSFKKNTQIRPFHNIDLYNLMCAMIGVEPAPNNGTWVDSTKSSPFFYI